MALETSTTTQMNINTYYVIKIVVTTGWLSAALDIGCVVVLMHDYSFLPPSRKAIIGSHGADAASTPAQSASK